jgi:hypothetical protein
MTADEINRLIAESDRDQNYISDGYHTFGELYAHRVELFIALCRVISCNGNGEADKNVWRSKRHSDGTFEPGWFLMGISTVQGEQISYHLPITKWDETHFASTLETAPEFDGHTSDDVLIRLGRL